MHGKLSHHQLAQLLNVMDCLVLPSRIESFGRVVMDALGIPAIVTPSVGAAEAIAEEKNGAGHCPADRNGARDPGHSGCAVHRSVLLRGSVLGGMSPFGLPSEGPGAISSFGRLGSLDDRAGAGSPALVDLPGASAGAPGAGLGDGFALAPGGSGAEGLTALARGGLSPSAGGGPERTTDGDGPGVTGLAAAGRDGARPSPSLA